MGGGGGGGGDKDAGEAVMMTEYHACEPNPQAAIDYVANFGYPDQGDMDCFADPVNACPGGCCRYANWFVCDTDDEQPHMPCVCNANTNTIEVDPAMSGNVTLGENITATVETDTTDPPLTMETLEEEFPEVLVILQAQSEAPPPLSAEAEEAEDRVSNDMCPHG